MQKYICRKTDNLRHAHAENISKSFKSKSRKNPTYENVGHLNQSLFEQLK